MNDDRSIDAIFCAAIEIESSSDRQSWIDQACGDDVELRRQVERLLQAHFRGGSIVDSPAHALDVTVNQPRLETPGTQIGPYKLLQQIGEGGMGTVYMAEQTQPVQRKVALKLIKAGMDSRQIIARFEAERQALAMMDHVNIARVLDAGTTDQGRPYFVMELVHGVPITKYCDDNRLTPRQRLELFVPVCQAIQHAHQKGIIHRDIKPSNVMVTLYDGKPVPKVIDFGVAKATEQKLTERTLFTQYGTMVGTLEYMSPEQAEMSALGVDTRSDIYSLGVLLYELLTGSTPLSSKRMKEAAYAEILRLIKEEEPPKPSTRLSDSGEALASISAQRHTEPAKLTKLMRGELDWIVMRSLEKDRNRRYETANGFAADVQRYLNDDPVQACPPSATYRFRKFARRNMAALGVAGMVLFFLVLLGSGAGWALRDREARELEIAQETARNVAHTEQGIRQALDRGTKSRAELHATLKRPGGVQQLLNQPARWEMLIKTAQGELAQARQLAGRAEVSLVSESTRAMDEFVRQIAGDQADFDLAQRLETIRLDRATVLADGWDYRRSADEYPKAFAGFAMLTDEPVTVAARLASSPIKEHLTAALDDWAIVAFRLNQASLAEQLLAVTRQAAPDPAWGDRLRQLKVWRDQEVLGKLVAEAPAAGLSSQLHELVGSLLSDDNLLKERWLRQAQAEYPADFWLNYSLAWALERTNPAEAAGYYRIALVVRPETSAAYNNLGITLDLQQKLPEAVAAYRKAIGIDPNHAFAHNNLGLVLAQQKKLPEAIAAYHRAIELDPKNVKAHGNLAAALTAQGKLDEAIATQRKLIATQRKLIELYPRTASVHFDLGTALKSQGKIDEAMTVYRKVIELDPTHADAYTNLGASLYEQKRLDEAIANCRMAIEIDANHSGAHINLGNAVRAQGKVDEAIACYRKSIELDPKLAVAHYNLGNAMMDKGKTRDEAIACFRNAIELDPNYADARCNLAMALWRQGRLDEAIGYFRRAIEIDPKHVLANFNLGQVLHAQQNLPEAIGCFRRAIELNSGFAPAHYAVGNILISQAKPIEAIASYRMAIELNPKFADVYVNLGAALNEQKRHDEAITNCRKAIELDPKHAKAHNNLANALSAQGKVDEAITGYRKAIELNPESALAYFNLGQELMNQGKESDAITAYRKAIELDPQVARTYTSHGQALSNKAWRLANQPNWNHGDAKRAVEFGRLAVQFTPESAGGWQHLGWVEYRGRNWSASIEALEKSCKLQEGGMGDAFQWLFLAMAHWQLGDTESARKWYDKAIEFEKVWPAELHRFRAEAEELLGVDEKKK